MTGGGIALLPKILQALLAYSVPSIDHFWIFWSPLQLFGLLNGLVKMSSAYPHCLVFSLRWLIGLFTVLPRQSMKLGRSLHDL